MPFENSYLDIDRKKPDNAREHLQALAPRIVQNPVSTHIIKGKTSSGKARFYVVDCELTPHPGDLIVYAHDSRFTVRRLTNDTARERIWGTVAWFIEQG